ncbi:hypothetical protein M5X04_26190 [Paenibacillus alvei]|uniref:Uncharacterized protein n=1 Tax=Paenibacillus alvei TaxID=44250 RepID=A0ABT4EK43_PAEAL|nr:hypothetical protein [Paenibacillus alvei]MCY9532803.1 hypothetical protein [Paenibacillus alvei]
MNHDKEAVGQTISYLLQAMIFRDLKVENNIEFTPRGNNEMIIFSEPLFLSDNRFALVHRDITRLEPPSFI